MLKKNQLFSAFTLRDLCLPNRVVMAPMTRNFSPNHVPGDDVAKYYQRRAEGGVGLIITEGTCVNHIGSNCYPNVPYIYGKESVFDKYASRYNQDGDELLILFIRLVGKLLPSYGMLEQ